MSTRDEAARGLIDVENFLFRNDHMKQARRRVTDFTTRVPGLSPEQKAAITRWYLEEQAYVARAVSEHVAERLNAGATAARARTRATGAQDDPHHDQPRRPRRGGLLTMLMITLTLAFAGAVLLTGPR